MSQSIAKGIIATGVILVVIGVIYYYGGNKLRWIGNLPGDIKIKGDNFRLYIPITTMILISIVFSFFFRLLRHLKDLL